MTISKERFNNLAINLSHSMDGFDWDRSDTSIITESGMLRFANALLKAVEAESDVVGYLCDGKLSNTDYPFKGDKELITLPLVEGD